MAALQRQLTLLDACYAQHRRLAAAAAPVSSRDDNAQQKAELEAAAERESRRRKEVRDIQERQEGAVLDRFFADQLAAGWKGTIANRHLCLRATRWRGREPCGRDAPLPVYLKTDMLLDVSALAKSDVDLIVERLTCSVPRYDPHTGEISRDERLPRCFAQVVNLPGRQLLAVPRCWGATHFGAPRATPVHWNDGSQCFDTEFPHPYATYSDEIAAAQRGAVEAFHRARHQRHGGCGCVVAECGTGKTYIAARLCHELRERMVFLVQTTYQLHQAAQAMRHWLPRATVTLVGGDSADFSGDVVIALVAKLLTSPPPGEVLPRLQLMVVDEAHHATSASLVECMRMFAPKDVLGLTGTPVRTCKDEYIGFWFLGPVLFVYFPDRPIVPTSALVLHHEAFFNAPTPLLEGGDGTAVDWSALLTLQSYDAGRSLAMVDLTLRYMLAEPRHGGILFCMRRSHAERLAAVMQAGIAVLETELDNCVDMTVAPYHGGLTKKQRPRVSEHHRTLVATIDVLSEGADFGDKAFLAIAAAHKSGRQVTGRVVRPGRPHAIIVDAVDGNDVAAALVRNRKNEYYDAKYEVLNRRYDRTRALRIGPYELAPLSAATWAAMDAAHSERVARDRVADNEAREREREKRRKARNRRFDAAFGRAERVGAWTRSVRGRRKQ